ncbi:ABC transporter permease [Enterocloster lavalensis]|uniref:ABC-2 type transport system permease protein n=2 Tax=Enterocloster TaxID=2719313 RepID=A0A1I0JX19_9FIRM|nr:ABC transporter permease [Enterocloster lavalensis]PST32900.1 ABC transporter permease [Enterocloster lavalensis]SEU14818.1 ABC-2 type transport system permease protein [Enterocloster lavalensis]
MAAKLVYLKLELKRALKRLPHMAAGAIVLMAMLGTIAFAASKLLYGETTLERVTIGVVLPEEDRIARQLVRMLGTYDSVRSVCEFSFMDSSEAEKQLRDGEIFGIMNVPEGLVQGIINGTNIPVTITLPQGNALENRVFKELTSAGARTLGSAQAGIYAGDQLLLNYDLAGGISQLEADLNRIYMAYSLPRADLFEHVKVSATGDVDTLEFYGISAFVLYLLLAAIPVSGYLAPESRVMSQKLSLAGIGPWMATAARLAGLGALLLAAALPAALGALKFGVLEFSWLMLLALAAVCLAAAALVLFCYEAAGTLMGGVMLLFLGAVLLLFLSGGFLPLVFLPAQVRSLAPFLPTTTLMNGAKMIVTGAYGLAGWLQLAVMTAAFYSLTVGVRRR